MQVMIVCSVFYYYMLYIIMENSISVCIYALLTTSVAVLRHIGFKLQQ